MNQESDTIPTYPLSSGENTNHLKRTIENLSAAGSEETLNPPADPSIWEETKASAAELGNQTDKQRSIGKKEPEDLKAQETEPKHNKSTF